MKEETGYINSKKASTYTLTQPLIVDKIPFYEKILQTIQENNFSHKNITIYNPGIGPGLFIKYLINHNIFDDTKQIKVIAQDISEHMLHLAKKEIPKHSQYQISLEKPIDLVNMSPQILSEHIPNCDVIISSQFEHYFPNSKTSTLCDQLSSTFSTKQDFRQACFNSLNDGGIYFFIDDCFVPKYEQCLEKWDNLFIKSIRDVKTIQHIASQDKNLAKKIQHTYIDCSFNEALNRCKRLRHHRRKNNKEEIQSLDENINNLKNIFGGENVYYKMHPQLPNFFLAWAIKN